MRPPPLRESLKRMGLPIPEPDRTPRCVRCERPSLEPFATRPACDCGGKAWRIGPRPPWPPLDAPAWMCGSIPDWSVVLGRAMGLKPAWYMVRKRHAGQP